MRGGVEVATRAAGFDHAWPEADRAVMRAERLSKEHERQGEQPQAEYWRRVYCERQWLFFRVDLRDTTSLE